MQVFRCDVALYVRDPLRPDAVASPAAACPSLLTAVAPALSGVVTGELVADDDDGLNGWSAPVTPRSADIVDSRVGSVSRYHARLVAIERKTQISELPRLVSVMLIARNEIKLKWKINKIFFQVKDEYVLRQWLARVKQNAETFL